MACPSAAEAMFAAHIRVRGVRIDVHRDNVGSGTIDAIMGRSKIAVDDGSGVARIEAESHDFIVRAKDYVQGQQSLTEPITIPQEGDRILRTRGQNILTFEVMTPPYDPHDAEGVLFRVHTKFISST